MQAALAAPLAAPVARCSQRRALAASPAARLRRLAPRRLQRVAAAAATAQSTKLPAWEEMYKQLSRAGVQSLGPEQAFDAVELGRAVLIDVRPQEDHDKAHPRGAVSVPAFLVIKSPSSPGEFAKWLACQANGVVPTKPNPELAAQVAAAAAEGKAVILACEAGGTLEPSINFPSGKVSRSLKAAWTVISSKALPEERVQHLAGGVYGWASAGLPMTGDYDPSNAGKTPNVAEKPTGRYFDGKE